MGEICAEIWIVGEAVFFASKPKGEVINFYTDNISRAAVHVISSYFKLHQKE
jgi:hypothetical protein